MQTFCRVNPGKYRQTIYDIIKRSMFLGQSKCISDIFNWNEIGGSQLLQENSIYNLKRLYWYLCPYLPELTRNSKKIQPMLAYADCIG